MRQWATFLKSKVSSNSFLFRVLLTALIAFSAPEASAVNNVGDTLGLEKINGFIDAPLLASLVCMGTKFSKVDSLNGLPPSIAKLLRMSWEETDKSRDNPAVTNVHFGEPHRQFVIGALGQGLVFVALAGGNSDVETELIPFVKIGNDWHKEEVTVYSYGDTGSLDNFLNGIERLYSCKRVLGNGTVQGDSEIFRLLRELALAGNENAQFALGLYYAEGRGVTPNVSEAERWFKLAAAKSGALEHALGLLYAYGIYVSRDVTRSIQYFRLAVDHSPNDVGDWAACQLGFIYEGGLGVRKNLVAAASLLNLCPRSYAPALSEHLNNLLNMDPGSFKTVDRLTRAMMRKTGSGKSYLPTLDKYIATGIINNAQEDSRLRSSDSLRHPQVARDNFKRGAKVLHQIDMLGDVKTVSLFMIQPFMESFVPASEHDIGMSGCRYLNHDPEWIDNLVGIIRRSNVRPSGQKMTGRLPVGVMFLTHADGTETRFTFEEHFPAENTVQGSLNDVLIEVDAPFVESIYRWALATKSKPHCDDWLKHYSTKAK